MFSNLIHYSEGAVVFLIMLSVLVAAHELGHYLFARLFGMGVEEFAVGMFGKKPIWTYARRRYRIKVHQGEDPHIKQQAGGFNFEGATEQQEPVIIDTPSGQFIEETTDFTIRPWPIGGFVRIKGMMPQEDGSEVHVPGGFYSKSPLNRLVVLVAGPLFSVLAGVIVMIPIFMLVGERRADNSPKLGAMLKDGPAYSANLRPLDKIVAIDGKPISTFYQIVEIVRQSENIPLHVTYLRGSKELDTTVTPKMSDIPSRVLGPDLQPTGEVRKQVMLGLVAPDRLVPLNFIEATKSAAELPLTAVAALVSLVKQPSTAKDTVGGPGTMLAATSDAVQQGFVSIAQVAALISISVGVFNLLPIYPLDGGQMMVAFAELLRGGRRLSMHFQNMVATLGFGMVLLIVVGVLFVDFTRFTGKQPAPVKIVDVPAPKTQPALAK